MMFVERPRNEKSPAEAGPSIQCEGTAQLFRLSAGLCRSAALRSLAGRRLLLHPVTTLAARARLIGGRLLLRGLLAALRACPLVDGCCCVPWPVVEGCWPPCMPC